MKQRNLLIGGAIFVILLVYVIVTQSGNKGFNTLDLPKLPAISAEDMSKVEIETVAGKTTLEKKDGTWQLTEPFAFPADPGKAGALERLLADLRITNMITQRSEAEADFGLTTPTAIHLSVWGKDSKKMELFVGTANDSKTGTHIRLPGKTGVYSLLGDITQQLNRDAKQWRSLKIFDFSTDEVSGVTVSEKGKEKSILRQEEVAEQIVNDSAQAVSPTALPTKMVWKDAKTGVVLADADINHFLNAFCRLTATDILDEDTQWNQAPKVIIQVKTPTKVEKLELLQKDDQEKYWVRRNDEAVIYKISEYLGKNLLSLTEK